MRARSSSCSSALVAAAFVVAAVVAAVSGCASGGSKAASGDEPGTALGVIDSRVGTGARAGRGQCLYVHYVGVLPDGRQFEASRDASASGSGRITPPIVFELGTRAVMPGWEQGLPGVQVGGVRRLFVPYRLAYGANGRPPAIPPRTDLVFDIELMAVAAPLPTSSNAMRAESAKTCPAWESVNRAR